jgi:integrase
MGASDVEKMALRVANILNVRLISHSLVAGAPYLERLVWPSLRCTFLSKRLVTLLADGTVGASQRPYVCRRMVKPPVDATVFAPDHVRQYEAHLFRARKLSAGMIESRTATLRFLFVKTLKRPYLHDHISIPKRQRLLSTVLSQEEFSRLIASIQNLMCRTILMTLYATGVRRSELCQLPVADIDSLRRGRLQFQILETSFKSRTARSSDIYHGARGRTKTKIKLRRLRLPSHVPTFGSPTMRTM